MITTTVLRWAGFWLALLAFPAFASLSPLTGVVQVAPGQSHTCALTHAGGLKCWGRNNYGQLGDGSTVDRALPVDVVGLESGVQAVSAGGDHTCALTDAGAVMCWGRNYFGQLGDGTTTDRRTPTQVHGLASGVQAISAGTRAFTCALRATGSVQCWGINDLGSLGNGGGAHSNVPTPVSGLSSGVRAISAGNAHACAILTATGGLRCWGYNLGGQIGDGSTAGAWTPVDVSGLTSGVATVEAGELHTCAVTDTGAAKCWGNNFSSQLGDGSNIDRFAPVDVVGLSNGVVELAAGYYHTCARMLGGTVRCWGNHSLGQLGLGMENRGEDTPVPVPGLGSSVTAITSGENHVCAIVSGGMLQCWGGNGAGQIGNGEVAWPSQRRVPVDVAGLSSGAVALATGAWHTCALMATGAVKCWGSNGNGQLGDGTTLRRISPVAVSGLPGTVQMVAAGENHTCALLVGGTVYCWGSNHYNQLGAPGNLGPHPPVRVNLPGTTAMISAGGYHTCAVNTAGRVSCWGMSPFVGPGGMPGTLADLLSGVVSVTSGAEHNCALTADAVVKCWGSNSKRQLGQPGPDSPYQTVVVTDLTPVVQRVSAGRDHNCILSATGRVDCWGFSTHGHAGSPAPMGFLGLEAGVHSIATGESHNCVVLAGAVKCWGDNSQGQLGNGATASSWQIVDVTGLSSGVHSVSAGHLHTCALNNAGRVACWGNGLFDQMGDGRFPGVPLPQWVLVDPAFFRDGFEDTPGF